VHLLLQAVLFEVLFGRTIDGEAIGMVFAREEEQIVTRFMLTTQLGDVVLAELVSNRSGTALTAYSSMFDFIDEARLGLLVNETARRCKMPIRSASIMAL